MNALLNRSSTNNKVTGKAAGRLTRSFYLIAICFPDLAGKPRSDFSGYFAVFNSVTDSSRSLKQPVITSQRDFSLEHKRVKQT